MNFLEQLIAMLQELLSSLPFVPNGGGSQYNNDDSDIDNESYGGGHGRPRRSSRRTSGGGGGGYSRKPKKLKSPSKQPGISFHPDSTPDYGVQGGSGYTPAGKGIADGRPLSSFPSIPNLPNAITGKMPDLGQKSTASKPSGATGGGFNKLLSGGDIKPGGNPLTDLNRALPPAAHGNNSPGATIDSMLGKAGFTPDQFPTMKAIIQAESKGNPNAINTANRNGTIDRGLAQINSVHKQFDANRLFDPQYNLNAAHEVFKGQGYKAWSTYNNGAYKKFLNAPNPTPTVAAPPHQPVSAPGTSATQVPFKAAVGNRGSATVHPPTPATSPLHPARNTRPPPHAVSKATGGTQHTNSSGPTAGHPAAKTKIGSAVSKHKAKKATKKKTTKKK